MTIEIRRGELADVDALVALHEEVHALHLAARPDQFKVADSGSIEARFRELLGSADARVWVATSSGSVVGHAVNIWCDIDQIGVASAHRRRGIARALIQAAVADARASGYDEVELSSWAFNTEAHEAFRRLGFVPKVIRFELKR
jgi:ribosomal protein S18 acetylase RimI-like enzyme